MSNKILELDTKLFQFFNQTIRCKLLDLILPLFTLIAGFACTIGICLLLLLFVSSVPGTKVLGAIFIAQAVSQLTKVVANRVRPHIDLPNVKIAKRWLLYDPSFPSAHTATICAWTTVVGWFQPILIPWLIILCALVGISRIYLGQHYPIDVIVGAFIGFSAGILVTAL